MAREPRWIVDRSEDWLTIKVPYLAGTVLYRVPARLEPDLISWFRRWRRQCWAVGLVSAAAFLAAVRFDGLLFFLMFGVIANLTGWPALRGMNWNSFQRAFPEAQWLGESNPAPASRHASLSLTANLSQMWWFATPTGLALSGLLYLLMSLQILVEMRAGRFETGFGVVFGVALIAAILWFYVRMVLHYIRHVR
jgi:hypothetical protein